MLTEQTTEQSLYYFACISEWPPRREPVFVVRKVISKNHYLIRVEDLQGRFSLSEKSYLEAMAYWLRHRGRNISNSLTPS